MKPRILTPLLAASALLIAVPVFAPMLQARSDEVASQAQLDDSGFDLNCRQMLQQTVGSGWNGVEVIQLPNSPGGMRHMAWRSDRGVRGTCASRFDEATWLYVEGAKMDLPHFPGGIDPSVR